MPESSAKARPEKLIMGVLLFAVILGAKAPTLRLPFYWDEVAHIVPLSAYLIQKNFYPILYVPDGDRNLENFLGLIQDPGHPPLVFLTVAFAFKLFGTKPIVAHTVNIFFAWAAVFFTYLTGRRVFGRGRGISAALVLFTSPLFFAISGTIHLTMATTAFTMASVYFVITRRTAAFALAGSLMMLTRGNAFLAYPAMFLYACLVLWDGSVKNTMKKVLPYTIPGWVYILWMAFHYMETGYFIIQPMNYFNVLPHDQLGTFFWGILRVIYIFFFLRGGYFLTLFVLVFLVLLVWKNITGKDGKKPSPPAALKTELRASKEILLFVLIALSYMSAFSVLQNLSARYLLPISPLLALMGVAALFQIFRKRTLAAWVIVALLITFHVKCWHGDDPLLAALISVKHDVQDKNRPPYVSYENNMEYVEVVELHREAARFLEEYYPDKRILSGWPLVIAYSYPYLGYVREPLNMTYIRFHTENLSPDLFDVLVYASESDGQQEFEEIFETMDLVLVRRFAKGAKRVSVLVKE